MTDSEPIAQAVSPAPLQGCWSRIGVSGDRSCTELAVQVHCRNCPVYAAGAMQALTANMPADYLASWTAHFARPQVVAEPHTRSVVLFRVAAEWFALPASSVTEVANVLPVHTLPHQSNPAILGVVNVRGALVTCVSLQQLLGVVAPDGAATSRADTAAPRRLLVIRWHHTRAVCPVDEVHGIHRLYERELLEVPTTVAKAVMAYSTAVLQWRERSVGVLDIDRLCSALTRSVA